MRSSDIEQLRNFCGCLGLKNKISKTHHDGWAKKPAYRIQFGNVRFYRWLQSIGLTPAKTYTIGKLYIPDKYFTDFLRGHLDGDGCITTYLDKWNTFKNPNYIYQRIWLRFQSASEKHIKWIRQKTEKIWGLSGHIIEKRPVRTYQTTSMWELKFGKKESIKLLKFMYYSNTCYSLTRKRIIAERFIK